MIDDLPELPPQAFDKRDPGPDAAFYAEPRFVAHIDERAISVVTELYRRTFRAGDTLLDLMSSWISHLPQDVDYSAVLGIGMNDAELAANPRLTWRAVQDLNADPHLPIASASVDGAAICVSIQYLQHPVAVLRDVLRALNPGAPLVITFSDRCFPTKAVAIWTALGNADHSRLAAFYLERAGFVRVEARELLRREERGDPLWAVVGRKTGSAVEPEGEDCRE